MYDEYSVLGKRLAIALNDNCIHQNEDWIHIELVDEYRAYSLELCKGCELNLYCLINTITHIRKLNKKYCCYMPNNKIDFYVGGFRCMQFTRSTREIINNTSFLVISSRETYRECFIALQENFKELDLTDKKIENILNEFNRLDSASTKINI